MGGVIATVGDVIAYWLSSDVGPWLRRIGFWYMELPALGLVILALTAVGVAAFRRRRAGAALALALPAATAGTLALHYLPHGLLVGLGVTLLFSRPLRPPPVSKGSPRAKLTPDEAQRSARARWISLGSTMPIV